jgi:hypothetical protein
MVKINPHPSPLSANATSHSPLFLSFCVSLSVIFALFPGMFYLSPFRLNTRLISCLIIIDRNKLI